MKDRGPVKKKKTTKKKGWWLESARALHEREPEEEVDRINSKKRGEKLRIDRLITKLSAGLAEAGLGGRAWEISEKDGGEGKENSQGEIERALRTIHGNLLEF